MSCNTTSQNYKPQYKEEEIYISRTIIKYDEYGNVISRDTYYDKEINYADRQNYSKIQPMLNTHYNQPYNQSYQSQDISSTHTSPSSSVSSSPTSPTSPNSVSIDMSNMSMYNY